MLVSWLIIILSLYDKMLIQLQGISMGIQKAETNKEHLDQPEILRWCKIGLHPIFHNLDELNKAKLQRYEQCCNTMKGHLTLRRKLIQHWIQESKPQKVKEVSESMSESSRASIETQILLYRCAIRLGSAKSGMLKECGKEKC